MALAKTCVIGTLVADDAGIANGPPRSLFAAKIEGIILPQ
jgi:hypothetical protein